MANYFYIDAGGQRRGPCNEQQLQALATRGILTPTTPLETDSGHQGLAGQIPGLKFNTAEPPPGPFTHATPQAPSYPQSEESTGSIFLWPLDFAFRDLRLPTIYLWACRICYAIVFALTIIGGLRMTFAIFQGVSYLPVGGELAILIGVPLVWLVVIFYIVIIRLLYEFGIILFNWIVETTEAAKIYNENSKKK